jgi:hypothetical protein
VAGRRRVFAQHALRKLWLLGVVGYDVDRKQDGENFSGMKVTGPISEKNKDKFEACTSKTKK